MLAHIGQVEEALGQSVPAKVDPQERLRATLAPLLRPRAAPAGA